MIQSTNRNSNQISAWGSKEQDFDSTLQNLLYRRSKTQQNEQTSTTIKKSKTQLKLSVLPPVQPKSHKSTYRHNKKDPIQECQVYPEQLQPVSVVNQKQTNMTFYNKSLVKDKKAELTYLKEKRLKQKKVKKQIQQLQKVSKTSIIGKPYSAKFPLQKDKISNHMKRAESTQKYHLRKFQLQQQHQIPLKIKLKVMKHANNYLNNVKKHIHIQQHNQLKIETSPQKKNNNNRKIQRITHALIGSQFNDQYLFDYTSKKTEKEDIRNKLAISQMCRIQRNLSLPNWH